MHAYTTKQKAMKTKIVNYEQMLNDLSYKFVCILRLSECVCTI